MNAPRYLPPPLTCETTADIAARSGGSFAARGEREHVRYALPSSSPTETAAVTELHEFLRGQTEVDFPPPFLATLPGGRVFGAGNVLSPDGKSIARDVSPDFGKAFAEHWLLTYKNISPPLTISGRTAVIATTLGSGYGHWLLEELPRLLAFAEVREVDNLIAHAAAPYTREALGYAGFDGRVVPAKREAHLACDELIVPSPGRASPATVRVLNQFADSVPRGPGNFPEKIYISRARARRRKVINEPALWSALEANGFGQVQLEALTWAKQIAVFRAARVVVAPHGAGLANLAFCEPGARIVELFHRSYVNGCYWQVAALQQLDYRAVLTAGDGPIAQELSANRLDMEVDVPRVMAALAAG